MSTENFEHGDLIVPMRDGEHLGVYLVESVGPTSDQLNCRSLSGGPLGQIHTYFPREVLWAWKPSFNRYAKAVGSPRGWDYRCTCDDVFPLGSAPHNSSCPVHGEAVTPRP